jgi:hypothetical protein
VNANQGAWLDALPPQADCLRDYQLEQVGHVAEAMRQDFKRILVQGATGSGKTHVIATIVLAAFMASHRVLILATRTRLVRQLHERLIAFAVPHGVIANPLPELRNYSALVQIASVDTLHRRAVVNEHIPMPGADVVIFDEAHLSTADTRINIMDAYPEALRIGFTATPARKSGRSLSAAFDVLILGRSIRELTAAGTLVPLRIFNTPVVTAKELRSVPKDNDGDYQPQALGELLSRPKLVGDVLENWLRIAKGKRTLLFCVNKTHGAALLADFLRQGIAAEMLTDQDEEATREDVIARLERGETHILVNCFLMSYGVDVPAVECIVLARPTRSLTMFLQMCLDSQTEVLTQRGWLTSEQMTETDTAASFDVDTGRMVWSAVREVIRRPMGENERMMAVTGPQLDLRVTAGHELIVKCRGKTSRRWQKETAAETAQRQEMFRIPVAADLGIPDAPLTDEELRLIGWFLGDGSINTRTRGLAISQSAAKAQHCAEIRRVLTACGLKFGEHRHVRTDETYGYSDLLQFTVSNGKPRVTGKHLRGYGDLGEWLDKEVPAIFDTLSRRQLLVLLRAFWLANGANSEGAQNSAPHTMTISCGLRERMADRLQSLCVLRGLRCHKRQAASAGWSDRSNATRSGKTLYEIRVKDVSTTTIAGTRVKDGRISGKKPYQRSRLAEADAERSEQVWCVRTDAGTIVTRRNGIVAIMGNCGRGLRPSPETGKRDCILIDHGHVVENLGLPQSDFPWTLNAARNVNREALERARKITPEAMRTCRECSAIWMTSEQGHACPECGWKPAPMAKPISTQEADLEEMADAQEQPTPHDQRVICFYREACGWYARRWPDRWMVKPKSGRWWAWVQTQAKFRFTETVRKPGSYWELSPFGPSIEVSGWLQHRIIKFARARAKAAA